MERYMLVYGNISIAWGPIGQHYMIEDKHASDPLIATFKTLDEAMDYFVAHYGRAYFHLRPNPYF